MNNQINQTEKTLVLGIEENIAGKYLIIGRKRVKVRGSPKWLYWIDDFIRNVHWYQIDGNDYKVYYVKVTPFWLIFVLEIVNAPKRIREMAKKEIENLKNKRQ